MLLKLKNLSKSLQQLLNKQESHFAGSEDYWKNRYKSNGNSGAGSYNELANFKADILNSFVKKNEISTIIEYGSGDGNQLKLSEYKSYIGFDVSPDAISQCQTIFKDDSSKTFKLVNEYEGERAQLTMSLDVAYHLVEDTVFSKYMDRLFDSSTQYVIIYSSNTEQQQAIQSHHVHHRCITAWVEANRTDWKLIRHIPNKYPWSGDDKTGSLADFYIFTNDRAAEASPR